jgi:hypothetical protein
MEKPKYIAIRPMVKIFFERMPRKNGYPDHSQKETVFEYLMTREQFQSHRFDFLIEWRNALLVLENPSCAISRSYCFFDQKTGLNLNLNSYYNKYVSAKAQITKITNAMNEAKEQFKPSLFITSIEQTDEWVKALEKLAAYQCKLKEFEAKIEAEKIKV